MNLHINPSIERTIFLIIRHHSDSFWWVFRISFGRFFSDFDISASFLHLTLLQIYRFPSSELNWLLQLTFQEVSRDVEFNGCLEFYQY